VNTAPTQVLMNSELSFTNGVTQNLMGFFQICELQRNRSVNTAPEFVFCVLLNKMCLDFETF